jgi:hypothetical protein
MVSSAIAQLNMKKAVGADGFDPFILKSKTVRQKVAIQVSMMFRSLKFPEYLSEAKLTLLSKEGVKDYPTIDKTRLIAICSYILKIVEKTLLQFVRAQKTKIFATKAYQAGFKAGFSTHTHLHSILTLMRTKVMKRNSHGALFFVDLAKAFDSVDRNVLFKMMR